MLSAELYGEDLVAEQLDGIEADLGFGEEGMETAYGLGMMEITVNGQTIFGHLGTASGFRSIAVHDRESGAIAVVTSNATAADVISPAIDALGVAAGQ